MTRKTALAAALVLIIAMLAPRAAAFNYDVGFWLARSSRSYELVASAAAIKAINSAMAANPSTGVTDLLTFPLDVDGPKMIEGMRAPDLPQELFMSDGSVAPQGLVSQALSKFRPDSVPGWYKPRYAVAITVADLRQVPLSERLYSRKTGGSDLLAAGRMLPAEPCVILAQTTDGAWFYVQTTNRRAWVASIRLAVAYTREHWLSYVRPDRFLTVTSHAIRLDETPAASAAQARPMELPMGTKLPLMPQQAVPRIVDGRASADCFTVLIPQRKPDGKLQVVPALIPKTADVFEGHLPLTGENIVRLAMKQVGSAALSASASSKDAYAAVAELFRCFGLQMPSTEQGYKAAPFKSTALKGESADNILLVARKALPGSILFGPGGPMVFFGQYGDDLYAAAVLGRVRMPSEQSGSYQLEDVSYNGVGLVAMKNVYTDDGNNFFNGLWTIMEPYAR